MKGRAAEEQRGPDGISAWRWEGSGWAQSGGGPASVTGNHLLRGTHRHFALPSIFFQLLTLDLVFLMVGDGRATAIQQPLYQSFSTENTQALRCNLLSNFGSVGKRER